MGYDITLVRSPPRAIAWDDLARAARRLGWHAEDDAREVRLVEGARLVARVEHEGGAVWCKLSGTDALPALIALADALGARARGDDFESYRAPDDCYVHPDDRAAYRTARAVAAGVSPRTAPVTAPALFRLGLLLACVATFLLVVAKG